MSEIILFILYSHLKNEETNSYFSAIEEALFQQEKWGWLRYRRDPTMTILWWLQNWFWIVSKPMRYIHLLWSVSNMQKASFPCFLKSKRISTGLLLRTPILCSMFIFLTKFDLNRISTHTALRGKDFFPKLS